MLCTPIFCLDTQEHLLGEDDLATLPDHQYTSTVNDLPLRKVRVVCSVAGMRWPLCLSAVHQALHGRSGLLCAR